MGKNWFDLDNAAKYFPSTVKGFDTRVFRNSCELKETVDGDILQKALDKTVRCYPHFNCILKRGLFWYYLQQSNLKATVSEEDIAPCSELYRKGKKVLLFRVSYFKKRINLEVFHSLTDGTGALSFFKTMISFYITEKHKINKDHPVYDSSSSAVEKLQDAFDYYYSSDIKFEKPGKYKTYQIKGNFRENLDVLVIEAELSLKKAIEVSHKYKVTLTALIISVYIDAILKQIPLRERNNAIVISVPVNLRNYFASETARNFFSSVDVVFQYSSYDNTLESIISSVDCSLKELLTHQNIKQRTNINSKIEHNKVIKVIPLFIKDLAIKYACHRINKDNTSNVSNVGIINLPDDIAQYINKFSVFVSTNSIQMCVCSFKDSLVIGITSAFSETEIQKNFLKKFVELGIDVTINSNIDD